jgi:hypothetical protein
MISLDSARQKRALSFRRGRSSDRRPARRTNADKETSAEEVLGRRGLAFFVTGHVLSLFACLAAGNTSVRSMSM